MKTETSPRLDNDSQLLSGSRGREVAQEQVELLSAQDLKTDAAGGGCFPTERLAGKRWQHQRALKMLRVGAAGSYLKSPVLGTKSGGT